MKRTLLFITLLFTNVAIAESLENRMNSLEERLDSIELSNALDKLNFSGSFLNQYQSFYQKNDDQGDYDAIQGIVGSSDQGKDDQLNVFFMRAELNFDVSISNNYTFYSTIAMSKFWNSSERDGRGSDEDYTSSSLSGGHAWEGSESHFDVAYLKYHKKSSPWTLAIGRMTTNNGPPVNQLDGLARTGTYPFMAYNVILDGAAIIYNFKDHLPESHKLKMRAFYTPFQYVSNTSRFENGIDETSGKAISSKSASLTLLTEYTYRPHSMMRSLDLFHTFFTYDGLYDSSVQENDDDIEYVGASANTVYFGFNQILNSGFNFSYTHSNVFIRNDISSERTSTGHLYNINYKFDNKKNPGHVVGMEYIKNDENKVPINATTMNIAPFYNSVNGEGYHAFYTVPFGNSNILRLGYMQFTQGKSEIYLIDVESKATSTYLKWKTFF